MKIPPEGVLFFSNSEKTAICQSIRVGQTLLVTILTLSLFCSCTPKTAETALPFETPDTFSQSGTYLTPDRWWTSFGDSALTQLIDSALNTNFNIRSAWQRLHSAHAVVDRESASLVPWVESFAQGGISKAQLDFQESQRFQAGIEARYEVDLWGRLNALSDAAQFRAQATFADYHTAVISVAAEITRSWFQRLEAQNQLNLIDAQIETNEQILSLIRNRFGTGLVRSVDILRQKQLIESAREQRAYIEADLHLFEHALAILSGRLPQDSIAQLSRELPALPELPETGVPLELIQRRPDVQSTYYSVRAADRDLAAAISAQYPRVSLSASASSVSDNVGNLFKDWTLSLAGNLLAPVFYGGRLRAEVDRNEAVTAELLNNYSQKVLTAFREVEDALILERMQTQSIASIEAQFDLAVQTYGQLRLEYFNGISDYLDVLVALTEQQRLERALVSARLNLIESRIALYRALAGSIETDLEREME